MSVKGREPLSRRAALATAGTVVLGGLAGCSSGFGSTSSGSVNSGSPTVELWTNIHNQSEAANRFMQEQIDTFQRTTNNTVNWVKEPVTNVQNGSWLQRMENGQVPTLYQTTFSRMGSFVSNDHVTSWGSVLDRMDESIVSGTEWAHDSVRRVFHGFSDDTLKMMPIGFVMQEPFVVRRDHFREAGLSIEEDFPPADYDELVDIATTLQEDGPADIGFQVHGSPGDLMDEIAPTWAHARGGREGLYVNQAWDDTNLDSDAWKWSLRRQVEIYRDLGLSSPNAASTSDEDACRLLIDGQASMSQIGMLNYGLFSSQAPEMLENGVLQFAPSWEGQSGYRGEFNMNGIGIGNKPPDMNAEMWDQTREAAIEFLNQLASVEVQRNVFDNWGLLPFNRNAWSEIPPNQSGIVDAAQTIAEGSRFGWQAHPDMADIQYNIPGPIFQQAMNGQISPEEACDQAAEQIRQLVFR